MLVLFADFVKSSVTVSVDAASALKLIEGIKATIATKTKRNAEMMRFFIFDLLT